MIGTAIGALFLWYEVCCSGSSVTIEIMRWIESDYLNIKWEFLFDSLTVSMLIIVTSISSLVHLYSTVYMEEDPHLQRFMGYLSLFTFFMIILITGSNLVQIFVGWEGKQKCLKWFLSNCIENSKKRDIWYTRDFSKNKEEKSSKKRRDENEQEVLSVIFGSLLGDAQMEKRGIDGGSRIKFEQCSDNVEYLMWFHKFFAERNYCNPAKPKLFKRIKKDLAIYYGYVINSYTFKSFNWIHEMFYIKNKNTNRYIKRIPPNIGEYLTPLALAIWFMNNGSKIGVRIATNCFVREEIEILCSVLLEKYKIKSSIAGRDKKGLVLYILKESKPRFDEIVRPYIIKSMLYKLGDKKP